MTSSGLEHRGSMPRKCRGSRTDLVVMAGPCDLVMRHICLPREEGTREQPFSPAYVPVTSDGERQSIPLERGRNSGRRTLWLRATSYGALTIPESRLRLAC